MVGRYFDLFVKESKAIVREVMKKKDILFVNILVLCLFFMMVGLLRCLIDDKTRMKRKIKQIQEQVERHRHIGIFGTSAATERNLSEFWKIKLSNRRKRIKRWRGEKKKPFKSKVWEENLGNIYEE